MASEGVCWGRSFSWSLDLVEHPWLGTGLCPAWGCVRQGERLAAAHGDVQLCHPQQGKSWGCAPGLGELLSPPRSIPAWPLCCGSLAAPCSSVHLGLDLELRAGVCAFGARFPGSVCSGPGVGVRRGPAVLQSTKLCLSAPLRARGLGTHNGAVCASVRGFPRGEMLFFPAGAAGAGGQRGWVCEGRQGRAGTQPRSVPSHGLAAGLNETLFPGQG